MAGTRKKPATKLPAEVAPPTMGDTEDAARLEAAYGDPVTCGLCDTGFTVSTIAQHLVDEHGVDPATIAAAPIVDVASFDRLVASDAFGEAVEELVTKNVANTIGALEQKVDETFGKTAIGLAQLGDYVKALETKLADVVATGGGTVPDSLLDEVHRIGMFAENIANQIERALNISISRRTPPRIQPDEDDTAGELEEPAAV